VGPWDRLVKCGELKRAKVKASSTASEADVHTMWGVILFVRSPILLLSGAYTFSCTCMVYQGT
jgi:hypothetical protein